MNVQQAYDQWANIYDTNRNRTRDLEAAALRSILPDIHFERCLEIGCGTGKNSVWLAERTVELTSADLSAEMLAKAREKVQAPHVSFIQADILEPWSFERGKYDLVVFSLVLEHIEDLAPVIAQAAACLRPGGAVYIGELHPFKQYAGTQARFETAEGVQLVPCFLHHVSDFMQAGQQAGLTLERLEEFFDDNDRGQVPRLLAMVWRKGSGA